MENSFDEKDEIFRDKNCFDPKETGIRYNYIICNRENPAKNIEALQLEDVLVPIPELKRIVERILGSTRIRNHEGLF